MFNYCIQKDTIKVEPKDFGKDPVDAIKEEIHRRYANKVIPDVGLCISLLDILETSEGAVLYGDGCFYYKTEFRLIIFRPYIGEVFIGKIKSMDESGIRVTLGFFDDIYIAPSLLPEYSAFDPSRRAYFWVVAGEPAPETRPSDHDLICSPDESKLYLERKDWVKIVVEAELFSDVSPTSGKLSVAHQNAMTTGSTLPNGTNPDGARSSAMSGVQPPPPGVSESARDALAPYRINCSMTGPGIGSLDWWDEEGDEEDEEAP